MYKCLDNIVFNDYIIYPEMERNYSKLKNIDEKFHKVALTISLPKPVDNFVDDLDEYFENPESHFSKNDLVSDYLMIDDDRDT